MEILTQISGALQKGEDERTCGLVRQAIDDRVATTAILNDGLIAGMNIVGEQFRKHEIFLPDVLLAAKAMTAAMELLKPLLIKDEVPSRGKVVIGSVRGDLHDIGKNLVGIMLKGAGFEVIDLGSDVAAEKFVASASAADAQVIGMSALLTTTMSVMKEVVELLQQRGLRDRVGVILGGAPVSAQFAKEIGADAYGFDAANAVERVIALLGAD